MFSNKLLICSLVIGLQIFSTRLVLAEDIEIYSAVAQAEAAIGATPNEVNPNVLFILDNSGSMESYRLQPLPPANVGTEAYDPNVDYGNDGNAANDQYIYIYTTGMNWTGEIVTPAQNVCKAFDDQVANFPETPILLDRIIQWDSGNNGRWYWWDDILTLSPNSRVLECQDDRGSHGRTNGASNKYPQNCRNGCSNSNARYVRRAPSGNRDPYRNAASHNMVLGNYHDYLESVEEIDVGDASDCTYDGEIIFTNADTGERGECKRKIEIMKEALASALDGVTNINLALMNFNDNCPLDSFSCSYYYGMGVEDGGTVIDSIGDINVDAQKQDFINKLNAIQTRGWTPLSESLYEAYRYFRGNSPVFSNSNNADSTTFSNNKYKSPIINECQDNNVVLLSDGLPTYDTDADSFISGLISGNCGSLQNGDDSCLDDIAGVMRNNDMSTGTDAVRGTNRVYTYTIGFEEDNAVLRDAADAGRPEGAAPGSGYFRADNILELRNAFNRIINQIQSVDSDTFVAPAVTVNAFNRLQNKNEIYYVLFAPSDTSRWNGNLKKCLGAARRTAGS
ncbi:MAG: hypothetical protein AAF197_06675 [Pseudomonadota bacterium]